MKASQKETEEPSGFYAHQIKSFSFFFLSDKHADNGQAASRSQLSELSCCTSGLISCLMQIERDEGLRRGGARLRKEALSGGY